MGKSVVAKAHKDHQEHRGVSHCNHHCFSANHVYVLPQQEVSLNPKLVPHRRLQGRSVALWEHNAEIRFSAMV